MPRGDLKFAGKNKLGLTLPDVPRDSNEQNASEKEYEQKQIFKSKFFVLNSASQMFVSNVYKKSSINLIVLIDKKIEWKNFLIQNVLLVN